jgi:hypothetical protein
MVPGISDQWLAVIMFAAVGIGLFAFGVISTRRFDARNRKRAAAQPRPEE